MTNETKSQFIEVVAKLIKLTQEGRITWRPSTRSELPADTDFRTTSSAFETRYRDQRLRIYRQRTLSQPVIGSIGSALGIGRREPQGIWITRVVLEFLDQHGETNWTFPSNSALNDLLAAVQYQAGGIQKFIDSILAED
jgi:hypothetical protein